MPVYQLPEEIAFPHPSEAEEDGLLAIGGDLHPERLLTAYASGIFPWYSEGTPVLWWSPDPRLVLYPSDLNVSKSLMQSIRSKKYSVTADKAFRDVMEACAKIPRKENEGTWILPEMVEAYTELNRLGFAHSFEVWIDGELCGGLYGISLGTAFFGESMFHKKRDASKIALYYLCEFCIRYGIEFIDAQQRTDHLERLGAKVTGRDDFLVMLEKAVKNPTLKGSWMAMFEGMMKDE